MPRLLRTGLFVAAVVFLLGCVPPPADEVFIVVTHLDSVDVDPGDGLCANSNGSCSLRAAVMEANANPNVTEIQLSGSLTPYTLSIVGAGEDNAATGDLDLTESTYIRSISSELSVIQPNGIDRIFEVHGGNFQYFEGLRLTGGDVAGDGGAILAHGGLIGIEDTQIDGNNADGDGGGVAGIGATLWFEDSTVNGNTSGGDGGAISSTRFLRLFQTTLDANSSTGVDAEVTVLSGELQVLSSTIVSNTTGIEGKTGSASLDASIVVGSVACVAAPGFAISSVGSNIATDDTCALNGPADQPSTNPLIGGLVPNGGKVPTRHPQIGSPAIDGDACVAPVRPDARQRPRPSGAACDVGAVEAQPGEAVGSDCGDPLRIHAGAQLQNCFLDGLDLSGADLVGADLSNASLFFTDLSDADLSEAILHSASFLGTYLSNASFVDADLTDADLRGSDLSHANLREANLTDANIAAANLSFANLRRSTMTGTVLGGSPTIEGLRSGGIVGPLDPSSNQLELRDGFLVGPGVNLRFADAPNVDFSGVDLTGVDLHLANLGGADLTDVNLTSADLTNASFRGATMTNTVVELANAVGADFSDADLAGVFGRLFGPPSGIPLEWRYFPLGPNLGRLVGAGADLTGGGFSGDASGMNLQGIILTDGGLANVDLTGTDLTGAVLDGIQSGGIIGAPLALPADWQVIAGVLVGPTAFINENDLSGADLSGLNLNGTRFYDANLSGADLTGSSLTGASFSFSDLSSASMAGLDLSDVSLNGTTANGTDLTDAILTGAGLNFAALFGADLTRVTSGGITGSVTSLPTDWALVGGYLFGPSANLSGSDFTGFDLVDRKLQGANFASSTLENALLQWADLRDADLTNANLHDATLFNADLFGADLTGADLSGVAWFNTRCPDGSNSDGNGDTCVGHL